MAKYYEVETETGTQIIEADDAEQARRRGSDYGRRVGSVREVAADDDSDDVLTGDALQERARELEIEGRSTMSADELRAAIAAAETDDETNGNPG